MTLLQLIKAKISESKASVEEMQEKSVQIVDLNLSWFHRDVQYNFWFSKQVTHQRATPTTSCNYNGLLSVQDIPRSLNSLNLPTATRSENMKIIRVLA